MQEKIKSRMFLIGVFAVFFGPLLLATWLFYVPNSWMSSKTQNHGELIQPAKPLDELKLTSISGENWSKQHFIGKWTLLYIGDENCDLYCEASLFKMRQVRLTLGRDSERVQRKYLGIDNEKNKQTINEIMQAYPQMQVNWFKLSRITNSLTLYKLQKNFIYLIDPLGNLMMQYSQDATSKGMQKDLKRLLKVSKIG